MKSMVWVSLLFLLLAPAQALISCGDGQCSKGEDWIGCFSDCPKPRNSWAVVGTTDAQTWVPFEEGNMTTVQSRMTAVPVDRVDIFPNRTVGRVFRIFMQEDSGVINPYSYFVIKCKVPLRSAWVHFSVDKSWLAERNMSVKDVGVFFRSGGWHQLDVLFKRQDATKVYYKFETRKFGAFAIGSTKGLDEPDTVPEKAALLKTAPRTISRPENVDYAPLSVGFSVLTVGMLVALKGLIKI